MKITFHGNEQDDGSFVFYNNLSKKQIITSTVTGVNCARNRYWSANTGALPDYITFDDARGLLIYKYDDGIGVNETIRITVSFNIQNCFGTGDSVSKTATIQIMEHPTPTPDPTPPPDPGPTPVPPTPGPAPGPDPNPDPTNYPSVNQLVSLDGDVSITTGPDGGAEMSDATLIRHVSAAWVDPRTSKEYNRMTIDISNDVAHSMNVVHEPDKNSGSLGTLQQIQYEAVSTLPDYITFDDYTENNTGVLHYNGKEGALVEHGQVDNIIVRYRALYSRDGGALVSTVFGTLTLKAEFLNGNSTPSPPDDDDIGISTWWVILLIVIGTLIVSVSGWWYLRKKK